MIKKILIASAIIFIGIQFIRPARNLGKVDGLNDISHYVALPINVQVILKRSCYDCHSNHTDYPWYVNINPVGLMLASHIKDGKQTLNFSDLSGMNERRLTHKLTSIAEQVKTHAMPIGSYTLIHNSAKLTDSEIKIIKDWTVFAAQHISIK
jgi:hypothetical protein